MAQWLKCLPCKCEALGSVPRTHVKSQVQCLRNGNMRGEDGEFLEAYWLVKLGEVHLPTWWSSRPIRESVSNKRWQMPEVVLWPLHTYAHPYTPVHLPTHPWIRQMMMMVMMMMITLTKNTKPYKIETKQYPEGDLWVLRKNWCHMTILYSMHH